MKNLRFLVLFILGFSIVSAQEIVEDKIGGWYGYFVNYNFKDSKFGIDADVGYRNWNVVGDLEQFLIRGAVYFKPKKVNLKVAAGYGYFVNGIPGESDDTSDEHRLHQDLVLPQKLGNRLYLSHRFRLEERWIENQDFRHRYRYRISANVPLNQKEIAPKAIYLSAFNEFFINGQTNIGDGRKVDKFDRNWTFLGLGYVLNKNFKFRLGMMHQYTPNTSKNQWLITIHHKL